MSLETQIAALVTAANNLTGSVNGKMGQIDQKVIDAQAAYDAQLLTLKSRLPRLSVTRNLVMADADVNGIPDAFGYHTEITMAKQRTVSTASEAAGRPAEDLALLAAIEADVREVYPDFDIRKSEYYRQSFTTWQMSWAENNATGYLAFPSASDSVLSGGNPSVPLNSYLTVAGFVKVVSGAVAGSWATGSALGKWRWCSQVLEPNTAFGSYTHLHPMRQSPDGVVQVALVGACTGVVSHPGAWFAQLGLS